MVSFGRALKLRILALCVVLGCACGYCCAAGSHGSDWLSMALCPLSRLMGAMMSVSWVHGR
jgi:hypothetical protein